MRFTLRSSLVALVFLTFLLIAATRLPLLSHETTTVDDSHVWYSQLAPGLSDRGLRIEFPVCLDREVAQTGRGIATLTPEMAAQGRSTKPPWVPRTGWIVADFCVRHGEFTVLGHNSPDPFVLRHRPPCWTSITVDETQYLTSEHLWYSSTDPKITSKGMRFFLPVCVTSANWGTTPAENAALRDPVWTRAQRDRAVQFTIDFCLRHGEVKVLGFQPPDSRILNSRTELCGGK